MFGNMSGPTLIVIIFIVLLLFGAPKLPALARSLGQSMKILKKEVRTGDDKAGDQAASNGEAAETSTQPAGDTVTLKAETPAPVAEQQRAEERA